jgi:hexosaminidase
MFPGLENTQIPLKVNLNEGNGAYTIHTEHWEQGISIDAGGKAGVFAAFSRLGTLLFDQVKDRGGLLPRGVFSAAPRFGYRGTMLDVARHFFPINEVKSFLDMLFRLGLNKFHWHIADDQGFRVALRKYPQLEAIASKRSCTYHGGRGHQKEDCDNTPYAGCYSEDEVRETLAYAAERGIEVIPEIDLPGHSSALLAAYPALMHEGIAGPKETPGWFGILENTICIGNDETMRWTEGLLHDLCDLFNAKTFHLGFDEVKTEQIENCPCCQAKIQSLGISGQGESAARKLIAYAKDYFRESLKKRGLEVIFYNDGMDNPDHEALCYHWYDWDKHTERTIEWINGGQKTIIAPTSFYYFDYPFSWTPLKKTYDFDPIYDGVQEAKQIIGIEAPIWTEYIETHDNLAFKTFYRLAALADTTWTAPGLKRPYADFMAELRRREAYYFGEKWNIPEDVLNPPEQEALARETESNMSLEYERFMQKR